MGPAGRTCGWLLATAAVLSIASCGDGDGAPASPAADRAAIERTVLAYFDALEHADGERACEQLTQAVQAEARTETGAATCPEALGAVAQIPAGRREGVRWHFGEIGGPGRGPGRCDRGLGNQGLREHVAPSAAKVPLNASTGNGRSRSCQREATRPIPSPSAWAAACEASVREAQTRIGGSRDARSSSSTLSECVGESSEAHPDPKVPDGVAERIGGARCCGT